MSVDTLERDTLLALLGAARINYILDSGDINPAEYDMLCTYYINRGDLVASGELPYGTLKCRTGDMGTWLYDRLERYFGDAREATRNEVL
jgi:hypothetical protein